VNANSNSGVAVNFGSIRRHSGYGIEQHRRHGRHCGVDINHFAAVQILL
jgi:hypothetical protein